MTAKTRPSRIAAFGTWLALPIYVWQGLGVRRRTTRLSPPHNPGSLTFPGKGEPIRLLVIGDSSAAGVGVDTIDKSFAGILPRLVAERSGRPVHARIAGMKSATTAHIRDHAVPQNRATSTTLHSTSARTTRRTSIPEGASSMISGPCSMR
jgi:hypothetical protein